MTDSLKGIDWLDREIINLIGQRFAYFKAATKFKTSAETDRL